MSLVSMPFVGSGQDLGLHVVASVVMIGSIIALAYGFWKLHELPINKAHSKQHQQIGLITALTWIGFVWHWVWVLAVICAFVDAEKALIKIRDIWHQPTSKLQAQAPITEATATQTTQEENHNA
ncbi:MFS transporter [Aliivibrio sifiae]|uniref:MFS transporter n=1 Tax=Aliivibrio sifiae TaxID=566293 RepID=A0A2S7X4G0_9GAMM|nr:MFS transporter [Aliivibrio sifiae]PQJ84908.1 MFS transporter [Aliivibrio sifiae]